jgi:hypothetical protein
METSLNHHCGDFARLALQLYPMGMENEPWQQRLRALGIRQVDFARCVGLTPTKLSEGLRGLRKGGVPLYLRALIISLEDKTPERRAAWVQRSLAERDQVD